MGDFLMTVDQMVEVLKSGSRLTGTSDIQSLIDVMEKLNHFLENSDSVSVEKVLRGSVESWLEENYILKLSQILQQHRVVEFLNKATQRFTTLSSAREFEETGTTKRVAEQEDASQITAVDYLIRNHVHDLIDEYVDSAASGIMTLLAKGESWRSVVSIVGPRGIGKTTLARKVYQRYVETDDFDSCVWIMESESYLRKELLKTMIRKIVGGAEDVERLDGMRMMQLIGTLRQSLTSKRYLIVFDNIVLESFWQFLKYALPNNGKGSRIIITTSSDAVVASCKEVSFDHVYKMEPLSVAMSWELFCRIAFQGDRELRCPKELEKSSLEFMRMCEGFPIRTVAMAGVLSTKERTVSEWKTELGYLNEIEQGYLNRRPASKTDAIGALEFLAPSFTDLPNNLRSCFLTLSLFPNNYLIPKDKVFKFWSVEGFVEENSAKTSEEVSQEYLGELIRRKLVHPCQGFYGAEKFFQVNKLVQIAARLVAKQTHLCFSLLKRNVEFGIKCPHLSISNFLDTNALKTFDDDVLRSVFFLNTRTPKSSDLAMLFTKCRLLTFLDFEYAIIEYLPEEVENLYHLNYLSLKNTQVRKLPNSVGKLHNLQTLDVRNTPMIELPIMINNLRNLRHLLASVYDGRIGSDSIVGVRIGEGFGCLEKLHSLTVVEAHHIGVGIVKELAKLQELRILGISNLTTEVSRGISTCIDAMSRLESLSLQSINEHEILDLESISSPSVVLKEIVLKGTLEKIPNWVLSHQNLDTLCLSLSRLTLDPLKPLSHLPNLVSLWLYQAYEGENFHFEQGSFKMLKLLVLSDLSEIQAIQLDSGALPRLEELRIGPAPKLTQVPSGIYYLTNLKVLAYYDMPREFVKSLQPFEGSEYWKVKHIPSVVFRYKVQVKSYVSYNIGDSDLFEHLEGAAPKTNIDINPHQYEHQLSFCQSDDEEHNDEIGDLSFSNAQSHVRQTTKQWSFPSSFYSDDLED